MPCFNICHKGEYKSTRGDQPTKSAQENDGSHLKRVKSSSPKKLKASGPPNPSSSRPCAKHWALILQIPLGIPRSIANSALHPATTVQTHLQSS